MKRKKNVFVFIAYSWYEEEKSSLCSPPRAVRSVFLPRPPTLSRTRRGGGTRGGVPSVHSCRSLSLSLDTGARDAAKYLHSFPSDRTSLFLIFIFFFLFIFMFSHTGKPYYFPENEVVRVRCFNFDTLLLPPPPPPPPAATPATVPPTLYPFIK